MFSPGADNVLAEWFAVRAELAALERAEHPDLVDAEGRRWQWWKGDLYRHERKAWPRHFLPGPVTEETR